MWVRTQAHGSGWRGAKHPSQFNPHKPKAAYTFSIGKHLHIYTQTPPPRRPLTRQGDAPARDPTGPQLGPHGVAQAAALVPDHENGGA